MSRSPYVDNVVLTKKHSGKRTHKVQAFVIHHMAARWTGKRCAEYFRDAPNRQASANYCIGYDGDVALNVEEGNRAWTSSSNWADQRALTYELANSKTGHPWEVSDKTLDKTIKMLAEQHRRYGLKEASYTGDTKGTLWRHDWFASTNCPGPYLGGKLSYMADEINKILRNDKGEVNMSSTPSEWAEKPWEWAEKEGLLSGRPHVSATRQEIAAILRSYDLKDNNKAVSEWAEPAWKWALENDLFNADNPHVSVSKQQLAVILRKFAEKFDLA